MIRWLTPKTVELVVQQATPLGLPGLPQWFNGFCTTLHYLATANVIQVNVAVVHKPLDHRREVGEVGGGTRLRWFEG